MRKSLYLISLVLVSTLIISCSSTAVEDYANTEPAFIPEQFFNGPLQAHGIVKDRSGAVTRRFTATLEGSWDNGEGLLAERFVFDDGEIQYRNWRLIPQENTAIRRNYRGSAEDVIGEAGLAVSGNAAFMQYTLEVPYNGRKIHVNVDDRMYLINDRVLIGESKLSKWGFGVGEIVLTIVKTNP